MYIDIYTYIYIYVYIFIYLSYLILIMIYVYVYISWSTYLIWSHDLCIYLYIYIYIYLSYRSSWYMFFSTDLWVSYGILIFGNPLWYTSNCWSYVYIYIPYLSRCISLYEDNYICIHTGMLCVYIYVYIYIYTWGMIR